MKSLKQIKTDLALTQTIKSVVQTYEELAVLEMQKIRDGVLTTRDFLKRILEVYEEVRFSYKEVIDQLLSKKQESGKISFSTLNKNSKKITILMTSNLGLSGDISSKVFRSFLEKVNYNKSEIMIVGKRGKTLYDSYGINKSYKYFDLPDKNNDLSSLKEIISEIVKYEDVEVYHGKLLNVVNQEGVVSDITAQLNQQSLQSEKKNKYIFEPSLSEVLRFFEVQIFSSLFKQTVSETNLANLGSRVNAMETASKNAEDRVGVLIKLNNSVKKSIENKKQLQRLAGMSLWK